MSRHCDCHAASRIVNLVSLAVAAALVTAGSARAAEQRSETPSSDEVTNSIGMKLKLIPAGEFLMGSSDADAESDEKPQHRVAITKEFYLQTTEVTQGQWFAVMGARPWQGKLYVKSGDDYAACHVSWDDAVKFCEQLSGKEGVEYRLPTEAEWEYACRAGSKKRFSFGNDAGRVGDYAWWGGFVGAGNAVGEQYAHRVGRKKANAWGLHDMHGNLWEWCADTFDAEAYQARSGATRDPKVSSGSERVLRGGSWRREPNDIRSSYRYMKTPDYRYDAIGFRVVRVLE